jgi:hypothetical protein
MNDTVDLKPEPAIPIMGKFGGPFQAAGRNTHELLAKLNETVGRGYNLHMAGIKTLFGDVNND